MIIHRAFWHGKLLVKIGETVTGEYLAVVTNGIKDIWCSPSCNNLRCAIIMGKNWVRDNG